MLLKVNGVNIESYEIIEYLHNKKKYYTYKYNGGKKIRTGDNIEFVCECGKKVNKKFYPSSKKEILLCPSCKSKNTIMMKYGVEYISQSREIKEKIKQTNMEKYGVEHISQSKEIKEKKKKTMLKNYGTANGFKIAENTIIERYGHSVAAKSKQIKDKIEKTNIEKYGFKTVLADKQKMKKAIYEKYGDENYNNREKAKQTNIKRYGIPEPWAFGSENQKRLVLEKSWEKFNNLETIRPLFTLEDYLKKTKKYQKFNWKCNECNTEFEDYYENGILPRCPNCFPILSGFSSAEKYLARWCKEFMNVEENNRELIKPYEIDIYLPDYKLGIEYNGAYWHSTEYKNDKYYHQNKIKIANDKGIRLLNVWDFQTLEDIKSDILYFINNLDERIEPKEPELYLINDYYIWF